MRKQTEILNVPFDVVTMGQAVENVKEFLKHDETHIICTPNPEIVMMAQEDEQLMNILKKSHMVVPDGTGVVWASKYSECVLSERVAGYDLTQNIFKILADTEETFYFFGGGKTVAENGANKMREVYPNLNIVGVADGYFDSQREKEIIEEINEKSPSVLLVGLGAPKQEKWIFDNADKLNVKVAIGVGGSFDVMAGTVKRAPKVFQKLRLEWFYRLLCQPSRWRRMLQLPLFVIEVKKSYKKSK